MTRKMILIAGVAGLALTAPAAADRGGEKGDKGARAERSERPQRAERAERPQRAERAERREMRQAERPQRAERAERREIRRAERPQRMERAERREIRRAERPQRVERAERREIRGAERPQRVERPERREIRRAERPQRVERAERREIRRVERPQRVDRAERREIRRAERPQRVERAERREIRRAERPQRIERQQIRQAGRDDRREVGQLDRGDRRELRQARRDNRQAFRANRIERQQDQFERLVERRQMRPMRELRQHRVSIGERIAATAFAPVPAIYGTRYADTNDYYHRYDDDYGYVYRVNRDNNFVSALMPLFGGYSIGDPWPSTYRSSYVPYGYQAYYYDTPDYRYRYDGNAIYQIDAGTQLISGIVALLLGQSLGVGQLLPQTYAAYNVPLQYRANYYDTNDEWYRYGDGFIYQVDPYTRRIEQRYPLYADNYVIGEPWPVAYPGYNVPFAYRDLYYDTPQAHYRYANNGIYRVDPTTQLITALVALVSGQNFNIGQPMPSGYDVYNVPFAYRDRWYDDEDDYYRYANGYVYEIDADSGLIEDAFPVYA